MDANHLKESHRQEKLKDARDYRNALINKREELEAKIAKTEERIRNLRAA